MTRPPPTTVAVISLGCPKALVDSEKMLADLAEGGCLVGAPLERADVILINTCAFIEPARLESYETIRQAVAMKESGSARRIVVAGCLPQREAERLQAEVPGVDAIIGVFNRGDVLAAVTGEGPSARVARAGAACLDDRGRFRLTPRHTAYLRLSEGCSAGCSYCTIPAIRGPLRSKPLADVLAEAAELAADGAVEINLIAQDTTAYGRDLDDGTDLAAALRGLDRIDALRWIRLLYAHPATMTDAAIDAMAECARVVKYLDLPLQHVSDRVLERMCRRYDRRRVEALLDRLEAAMPGIALRTTFIVGFPGERREDFAKLRDFVTQRRFSAVGVFAYCREAGTPAAGMDGQVAPTTAERRRRRLMRDQQEVAFVAGFDAVGREVTVLVDGIDPSCRYVGRHAGQAPEIDGICYLTEPAPAGEIVSARVVGADGYDLVVEPESKMTE